MMKPWDKGHLQVSTNNKYLTNGKTPFFWLGDTAWLLFEKLTAEQCEKYLKNRKHKHFNVIQATLIHRAPQYSGWDAFIDHDFGKPNPEAKYWQHVDRVVEMAADLGIYMALLPSWGSEVKQRRLNLDNVEIYGEFLAERYGKYPNVIWLTGGDIRGEVAYELYMKLGALLKEKNPHQLVGFHPFGRTSSSLWFSDAKWLDFNMYQSGHRRYDQSSLGAWDDNTVQEGIFGEDSWRYVLRDHQNSDKPTLDGEPSYEQIPQGLHDPAEPYWQDHDIRRYAYWSVFAGACGHTYGHSAIMQCYQHDDRNPAYGVKSYWHLAMHDPGAGQMGHLYRLMNDVNFTEGYVDESLLAEPQRAGHERIAAFRGTDFVYIYTYSGHSFTVNLDQLSWSNIEAYWFDPVAGIYSYFGSFSSGEQKFIPPVKPQGQNDWVLVLRK